MAPRINKNKHDPATIERIRATVEAGYLVKRLKDHVKGNVELSKTQVSAALGLLKKAIPDLAAVTLSGDASNPVAFQEVRRTLIDPKS